MSEVINILKNHKAELFYKYPIKTMALFGSFARGDEHEASDVDILVSFSKPVGMEFLNLAHELEDMLEKKVDLVSQNGIKPHYYQFIEKDLKYV